jgi:hypothetical protein
MNGHSLQAADDDPNHSSLFWIAAKSAIKDLLLRSIAGPAFKTVLL